MTREVIVLLAAVALGVAVVKFQSLTLVALVAAVAVAASLTLGLRWLVLATLIFAYMNALPFVDLVQIRLPASVRFDDVVMAAVMVCGIAWTATERRDSPIGLLRFMMGVFAAYWVLVLAITVVSDSGSLMLSALYGRDMLAITMSLAIAAVCRRERDQALFTGLIVAVACLHAVAHLLQFSLGVDTAFITHPYKLGESVGTVRIFSKAMVMIVPALLLSLGHAIVSDVPRTKALYWTASGLLTAEILIQLTRANYAGLIGALLLGSVLLSRLRTSAARSRVTVAFGGLAAVTGAVWIASGTAAARAWFGTSNVVARFVSTSTELVGFGGTFGYRLGLYRITAGIVGSSWLTGVGFLHPEERYLVALPQGSIRNNDTGILATWATMGLVGVGLLVWPLVVVGRWAYRALRSDAQWIQGVAWATMTYLAWVTVTAFSLGFLAFGAGLAATAIIVGLMTGAQAAEVSARSEDVG